LAEKNPAANKKKPAAANFTAAGRIQFQVAIYYATGYDESIPAGLKQTGT